MENNELLTLKNVSYEHGGRKLLTDVSFSVKEGENIAIFGPEESGIEIICSVISGTEEFVEGGIYYKGKSIKKFDYLEKYAYRKKLGYLQWNYGLINNMSVEENISLPLKYHSKLSTQKVQELVEGYIKMMNLEHCRNQRPVGLTRSESLKTAYARSITLEPDLLLIEHALGGQCMINIQTFLKYLRNASLNKGKSVIFATYDPKLFVDYSDRFIMLYKGSIVFTGNREELLSSDNQYLMQYLDSSIEGPMEIK